MENALSLSFTGIIIHVPMIDHINKLIILS